jgi:lysophospholipase L1-like esterase
MASRSGLQDRRGFVAYLKVCMAFVAIGLALLVLFSWKIGLATALLGAIGYITGQAISAPPANSPREFGAFQHRQTRRRPVLVCLGDSLTHGNCSASITPELPTKLCSKLGMELPKYGATFADPLWVVNCGQNGITSETIFNERLNKALGCYPDYVMIWIGTNDVRAMYKRSWGKKVTRMNQLSAVPTMDSLERNISGILQFIEQASPTVKIGLCTLPPLGENLKSEANKLVRQANEIIERVAATHGDQCTVISIFSQFETILEKDRRGGSLPVDFFFPIAVVMNTLYHTFPNFFSWNLLSSLVSNSLLTDGLHINERGADLCADLVVDWLLKVGVAKAIAVKA